MTLIIELEREDGGRSLAEALELPGVLVYGRPSDEAFSKAQRLTLRAIADRRRDEGSFRFVNVSLA